MQLQEPEKKICQICGMEGYKIIDFYLNQYQNLCKKCVAKKQKTSRERRYGKSEGWDWRNEKFCAQKR